MKKTDLITGLIIFPPIVLYVICNIIDWYPFFYGYLMTIGGICLGLGILYSKKYSGK